MARVLPALGVLAALGLLAWGCGDGSDGTGGNGQGAHACTPGQSVSCAGPNACVGFQVCASDGSKFETCQCSGGDASTGGAGGAAGGSPSGGTSGSSGSPSGGTAGADGGVADASIDGGSACSPAVSCWNKTKVGSGTPNKAFVDKNGKLYVGDAALGYFTNASGPWVSKSLNSDRWAIDENGNPHTVRKVGAGSPLATSGLVYSKLVGGTWASEDIPEVDGCECPVTPPCAFIVGPTAWDIVVAPGGAPHVVWNDVRSFGCGGSPIAPFPMHSYKNGVQWVTDLTAIWLENNGAEAQHVAGIMDGTHFAQAFMTNGLRAPRLLTTNPSGIAGVLYTEGEASGQIVLAKPNGLPVHALFSGWWYDELGPEPTLESVILTEDVAEPKQTNAKTTLLSCPGEQAKHHALAVSSAGVVWAAWLSTSDQIRFATNESGVWVHADLGTGTGVEVVVTGSGQVNVFIGQSGDIYWMTPCS